jgi:hypothetical protein
MPIIYRVLPRYNWNIVESGIKHHNKAYIEYNRKPEEIFYENKFLLKKLWFKYLPLFMTWHE